MFALSPAFLAPAAPGTDPLFASVALLLHMDGTNGSTTFTDSSGTPKTVTANGNAQLSTSAPIFGSASGSFDGTGDFLEAGVAADWTALHDGTTAWTIDIQTALTNFSVERALVDTTAGTSSKAGIYISVSAARAVSIVITRAVGGSFVLNASFGAAYPNDSNPHHLRVTYDPALGSNHVKLYVDGTLTGQTNKLGNSPSGAAPSHPLQIGRFATVATTSVIGSLDEVRVTFADRGSGLQVAPWPNSA